MAEKEGERTDTNKCQMTPRAARREKYRSFWWHFTFFTIAIASAGCRVNAGNNAQVLSAAGVSEDAAAAIVQALLDSGEAVREGGDLVLRTGGC